MNPRILILYASVGSGHGAAAGAIQQALHQRGITAAETVDILDYGGELMRTLISETYLQLSNKAPQLYKIFYEAGDTTNAGRAQSKNQLRGQMARPFFVLTLDKYVKNFAPDILIATHFLPMELLLPLKEKGELPVPFYEVITDFMTTSDWIQPGVNGYFVASKLTRQAMLKRGIAPELVQITGIPIANEISLPKEAGEVRRKHELPTDKPLLLLLGGGIPAPRVKLIVSDLVESDLDGTLVVVSGRNEKLEEALTGVESGPHLQLRKYGSVDFLDDLIAASDLVITKAGGLIVSEILARGTPMIIVDPIPGQEEWNADYVASTGAGIQLRMTEAAPDAVYILLQEPERLAAMRRHAIQAGKPHAAERIANFVLKQYETALI